VAEELARAEVIGHLQLTGTGAPVIKSAAIR
jgi:hypothetical protein